MKQTGRRLIAMLCVLCMLFSSMPVSVYADPAPATPTDLTPVQEQEEQEEQENTTEQKTGEEPEQLDPEDSEAPAETEDREEKEVPEEDAEPESAEEKDDTEPEMPEIEKPQADQEVSGYDDITVTASLEGEEPADYLIRFIPTYSQTLYLILTADGGIEATVTDEKTGIVKKFIPDETDQNVLTLPYYKVKDDSTYLIRLSAKTPVSFSLRMVKTSILKAEKENALKPAENPATEPDETKAEQETVAQPEEPASEPEKETEAPEAKPAEQAKPAAQIIIEPEAQDIPSTPTDLEPAQEEEPVEIRIEAADSPVKADIVFMSDTGIPQDAELQVRELTEAEQAAYQARTVRALKCEDETYLYYTKYLALTLLHNGEPVELKAPATVSVTLTDVGEGIDALQVVRFGGIGAKLLESERTGDTISFRTSTLAVFGIGNALTPLDTQETELVSVEVLSFSPDAEVSLKETKAPEVEEGLEVLGTFHVEEQTKAAGDGETDGLWIKAELNEDAELAPMESVSLYRVEDGQAEILVEDLSQNNDITELDAEHVAVIKDTGYRHLTLTVNPEEGSEDQTVTLDGMMPKEAEATVEDVTFAHAEASGMELSEVNYASERESEEETVDSKTAVQIEAETEPDAPKAASGTEDEETAEETTEEADEETAARLIAAYDITILNGEEPYQPGEDKPITVEILDSRITTDRNIELWHIQEDGTEEQVTEFALDEGRIAFEATGFSVYRIVEAEFPEPQTKQTITNLNEITEGVGYHLSLFRSSTYYLTNESNNNEIRGDSNESNGAAYYFERPEGSGEDVYQFYIYCMDGENQKYLVANSPDNKNLIFSNTEKTLFTVEKTKNQTNNFYIYVKKGNTYYAVSVRSTGYIFLETRVNGNNPNERVYITTIPDELDDPYELDGKQYGLMSYQSGITGYAITTKSSGSLAGQEMMVKQNPLNRKESLYVAKNTDISIWQFNTEGEDIYTLSTDVNGSTKFLKVNTNGLALVNTEDEASRIQVVPGTGTREGKFRLKDKSTNKTIYLDKTTIKVANDNAGSDAQYLNFAVLSDLEEDDFVAYSAQKVSIANNAKEETGRVSNGDLVVIYTRKWNDTDKHYDFYVLDHNGDLVKAYEEGNSIQWVGTKINTAVWHFTEYYWEGTNEPNYYYELKNDYTNQYLAPQVSGQIFSGNPIGINLNGRRYNDYYSTILAWDDPTYAYAGIKTTDDGSGIESCRIGKAEDFYFAKVEIHDPAALTPVTTVDHTEYGITMKMVDFNNATANPQGTTTDVFQHEIMGDTNKYDAKFDGTKGLLSTDLQPNGYPIATHTGRSLGDLFAGANEVNHLFLNSTYYGSGYFSYDSAQNFASLQGNNFTVYREIGTDDSSSKPSLKHGNFFPYNNLTPGLFASVNPENMYTATQVELDENYPRKHEKLYLVRNTDCYFGMEISASFVQTPNGKDAWNHDIIYEFVGDDDFWLYVDDELVVDLGGIHSALSAKVNYATGTVDVGGNTPKHTTLYEVFKENYKARHDVDDTDPGLQDYLAEKFTQKNGNWVFKDYSTHTMRIFYMERGGGASNLKMRFNLASVNPNQILLTKDVSGIADAEFLTTKFPYQIWFQPPNETEYTTMIQGDHDVYGYRVTYKNTKEKVEFEPSYTIGNKTYENVFLLKPGQTVEINTPDSIGKYRIVECGVPGNIYNKYEKSDNPSEYEYRLTVNDDTVDGELAGADAGNPFYDYTTTNELVTERAQVVFTNHVNADYLRTLSVTKKLLAEDGTTVLSEADDPTGFRYRLYLGEHLGYYNMGDYYIKNPEGEYCRYGRTNPADPNEKPHFISTGKNLFANLTKEELYEVTFTTSPSGSIDKIPAGYTVEVRDLPVGTKFKVEEQGADLPEGYILKKYERDEHNPYIYQDGVINQGEIEKGHNARLIVVNQRGWGLTAKKVWTDKHFTKSHDPIYVAVYTGDSDEDLLPGTIRQIAHPSTKTYYFFSGLVSGKTFADYSVCEVRPENPVLSGDEVTGYDSIQRIDEGVPIQIGATDRNGNPFPVAPNYLVMYEQGEPTGVTNPGNVRTDTITNQREGGIIIRLYDWIKDWTTQDPGKPIMLAGGVFTLTANGIPVGNETYTSDSRGLITVLYDFETDVEYTLTQISAPEGYQGLTGPITFTIPETKNSISASSDASLAEWFKAEAIDQSTGENLIAYVNVKNRPYTLEAIKYDPSEQDYTVLPNTHFALYKQYTYRIINSSGDAEETKVKDYIPVAGYEDLVTNTNGIVNKINETLTPFTYYLSETIAPDGYEKKNEDILFTISELGYVTCENEDILTETLETDGSRTYKLMIPNKKLSLVPPVLYVSKFVSGSGAQDTLPFRFEISGLLQEKEYVYQLFSTTDGVTYTPKSGAASLGLKTVNSDGVISFDLMHNDRIGISLPYNSSFNVAETGYDTYTPTNEAYSIPLEETNTRSIVELSSNTTVNVSGFISDVYIDYTNTKNDEMIPAPTGLKNRSAPYLLMMAVGLLMMTVLGEAGLVRRKKRLPDTGPAKAKVQSHRQWVEYRTPLVRGAPPSAPPCPQADLWTRPEGSAMKRGDPEG